MDAFLKFMTKNHSLLQKWHYNHIYGSDVAGSGAIEWQAIVCARGVPLIMVDDAILL